MAAIFNKIKLTKPKRNSFDLSHERKMSLNMGNLVPCMLQEVIPGDEFRVRMEHLIRFQPLNSPLMHRVNVYTHFFFVPYRLLWNEFEDFITGGEKGDKNPLFPTIPINMELPIVREKMVTGSLADYLGIPCHNISNSGVNPEFSALPFRAYQLIYNEYYRDQNLKEPVSISKASGKVTNLQEISDLLTLRKRAWEKDYFTSALPYAQKGEELSVNFFDELLPLVSERNGEVRKEGISIVNTTQGNLYAVPGQEGTDISGELKVSTKDAKGFTINELRQSFRVQKWLEKNARGGSRYIEHILSHFGVQSSDARLQRPEYLGGGKTPVVISEVLQQSATQSDSPLGTMGGHGISAGSSNQFKSKFEEHGFVIGIMSVLPRTAYMDGLPRIFRKFDKFDYFFPEFAHLGEQSVFNYEVFYSNDANFLEDNNETFGYQPRYAEYRFNLDTVHGDFKTNLDFWHMARKFKERPFLNSDFVESNPTHRIFPVIDVNQHKLLCQTYVDFQAIRPIPKFGTPMNL